MTLADLWAVLQVGSGWFLIERRGGTKLWVDGKDSAGFVKWCERMAYPGDCEVNVVPLLKEGEDLYHTDSAVLWARVEDGRALAALRRFPPGPTAVFREGGTVRHVALWALEEPLAVSKVTRANKRIAHALGPGARKKFCDVDFRMSPPGTVLRRTSRPVPVHHVGGTGEFYRWGDVVGRLRDAPDPLEAFERKIGRLP